MFEAIGNFTVDNTLGKPLDHGRLTDTGFTDKHRVIFRAALQNLHRATNFIIASDYRIDFSEASTFG